MVLHCQWGDCNGDERYPDSIEGKLLRFPNPKMRKDDAMAWIKACNRLHKDLNVSILEEKNKRRHRGVCSGHFVDGGPSDLHPYPIPFNGSSVYKARPSSKRRVENVDRQEAKRHCADVKETMADVVEDAHCEEPVTAEPVTAEESSPEDVRPVLEEGCLWPNTDHTYCSPSLVKENLEKPNGFKTDARRQKSGSGEEKTTWSATDKREGLGSKTKAKKAQKSSKNDAKKSKFCVEMKDHEKTEVCCAVGCRTGHHKSNKSLFVFPVHKARCIEWLQNLERQDLQEKSPHQLRCEGFRVCSDHFEPEHIVHVRQRPQLTRSAMPTLLKSWKRQTQKSRPAEGQHRQPPARQKKNKCRGQAKEHPGSDLLQIKVEIDWAEDPLLHCSTQVLTDLETREERMVLPRVDHTDFNTSSTSAILNNIKSEPVEEGEEMEHIKLEPVEEGEEMEHIKLEPVEEEERLCGDNRESLDLPRHRSAGCGQSNSVDNGNQSRLQVCVSDIKSEPDSDNMEESHWIQSLHHAASDIKLEPHSDDVAELDRIQPVHYTNKDHVNSVEQFSHNSKLTSRKQIYSSDEQIHTNPYHTYSKSTASHHGMNSSEHIDNIEQYGGNGTMTFASRLIEENDVEMSYTVVKTEPESDMEEV